MKPSPRFRRLDQLLSNLGYASRREVLGMLHDEVVMIGDRVADRADERVDAALVTVDGEPLEAIDGLLAILHKPVDYACTRAEGEGPTIYDLLPERWSRRNPAVTSVGRLDKDTSGLILITDQGPLVQRMTSPRSDVTKTYIATLDKDLVEPLVDIFDSGTILLRGEDKPCLPAKLVIRDARTAEVTLTEGRYHQVRRMFASQGWHVEALHRAAFGIYTLEGIPEGEWRLTELPAA